MIMFKPGSRKRPRLSAKQKRILAAIKDPTFKKRLRRRMRGEALRAMRECYDKRKLQSDGLWNPECAKNHKLVVMTREEFEKKIADESIISTSP